MNVVTHFDRSKTVGFKVSSRTSSGPLDGTGKSVLNLSTFLLRSLKAERCDFLGENHSGAGALSKRDSALVFLLLGTVQGQLQILQNR